MKVKHLFLNSAMLLTSVYCYASSEMISVDMTLRVIAPSCEINNGSAIRINFGNDILTTDIDGINFKQKIPLVLDCKGIPTVTRIQIQGQGSSFDPEVLKTDMDPLGIRMEKAGGIKLPLNTWVDFDLPNTPELHAVLVKKNNESLLSGPFSASAILTVEVF